MTQYFVNIYLENHEILRKKLPYSEFYNFFNDIKDNVTVRLKFEDIHNRYKELIDNFNIFYLFSGNFDEFGEIIHISITDKLKKICTEMIKVLKEVILIYIRI